MERPNPIRDKSFDFALRAIGLYKKLVAKKQFVLSKQFLRSGTSIGANVEEALQGQSKKDFIAKLSIALKETCETSYWIRLLHKSDYISHSDYDVFSKDADEIRRLLTAIIKTWKAE